MSSAALIPEWYIEFQAAVLKQLPRPGSIDQFIAEGWISHQVSLKENLHECLVPPVKVAAALAAAAPTAWTVDEEDNIHFMLTSNGFTREQWEQHLGSRGWCIGDQARIVLRRAIEAPTNGVTYKIVVRPGNEISDSDRMSKKIRAVADKKGWGKPHWEVACLIRDTFTDQQVEVMGLWYIVTMHEPIKDSDGDPNLLGTTRHGDCRGFYTLYDDGPGPWRDDGGFAFVEEFSKNCEFS